MPTDMTEIVDNEIGRQVNQHADLLRMEAELRQAETLIQSFPQERAALEAVVGDEQAALDVELRMKGQRGRGPLALAATPAGAKLVALRAAHEAAKDSVVILPRAIAQLRSRLTADLRAVRDAETVADSLNVAVGRLVQSAEALITQARACRQLRDQLTHIRDETGRSWCVEFDLHAPFESVALTFGPAIVEARRLLDMKQQEWADAADRAAGKVPETDKLKEVQSGIAAYQLELATAGKAFRVTPKGKAMWKNYVQYAQGNLTHLTAQEMAQAQGALQQMLDEFHEAVCKHEALAVRKDLFPTVMG